MSTIEIAVSPFYRGHGWTDRGTGLRFEEQGSHLKTIRIETAGKDLSGIKNSLRLNHLILIDGEIPSDVPEFPEKINPDELSGEEFDALVGSSDRSNEELEERVKALKTENKALKEDIEKLKNKIIELQEELQSSSQSDNIESEEEEKDEPLVLKRNKDGSLSKTALNNDFNKDELFELAEKEGLDYKKSMTKPDLVDLIADELE